MCAGPKDTFRDRYSLSTVLCHTRPTRAQHMKKVHPADIPRRGPVTTTPNDVPVVVKGRPRAHAIAGGHWPSPCPRPSRSCFSERRQRGGCFDQPGRRARKSRVESVELSTRPSSDVEDAPSEALFRAAQGGDARREPRERAAWIFPLIFRSVLPIALSVSLNCLWRSLRRGCSGCLFC